MNESRPCTVQGIYGSLRVSPDSCVDLLPRLLCLLHTGRGEGEVPPPGFVGHVKSVVVDGPVDYRGDYASVCLILSYYVERGLGSVAGAQAQELLRKVKAQEAASSSTKRGPRERVALLDLRLSLNFAFSKITEADLKQGLQSVSALPDALDGVKPALYQRVLSKCTAKTLLSLSVDLLSAKPESAVDIQCLLWLCRAARLQRSMVDVTPLVHAVKGRIAEEGASGRWLQALCFSETLHALGVHVGDVFDWVVKSSMSDTCVAPGGFIDGKVLGEVLKKISSMGGGLEDGDEIPNILGRRVIDCHMGRVLHGAIFRGALEDLLRLLVYREQQGAILVAKVLEETVGVGKALRNALVLCGSVVSRTAHVDSASFDGIHDAQHNAFVSSRLGGASRTVKVKVEGLERIFEEGWLERRRDLELREREEADRKRRRIEELEREGKGADESPLLEEKKGQAFVDASGDAAQATPDEIPRSAASCGEGERFPPRPSNGTEEEEEEGREEGKEEKEEEGRKRRREDAENSEDRGDAEKGGGDTTINDNGVGCYGSNDDDDDDDDEIPDIFDQGADYDDL